MKDLFKEFKPSSWAINNKTSIFILTVIITFAGIFSYNNIPKELFPEIVIPTIFVNTFYPGTSPADMENLVTKQIEKQIKSISGIEKMTSNSVQDLSSITVEFNTSVDVADAKQKVKDAVDKARTDLPTDLPKDPVVMEVDFSEFPVMFVNISGNYDLNKLKKYADVLKDKIETLTEITRVDIVGALEREIQINVDMYKMQVAKVTMDDIARTVSSENLIVSGGTVKMDEMRRTISISGEFKNMETLKNIVISSMHGSPIYLKDIAEIKDGFKEKESYARLDHKNVISLNIIKKSGENLIDASDKVRGLIKKTQETIFPENLKVTVTGDQSIRTRSTVHDLINTIIIGFILVTIVLMFFMGGTNAFFVAMSVPLSMFVAFMILPGIGYTMNMIVLFSFLLGLGIVVDDAIVVIENTHRIFDNGKVSIIQAAKNAAGEVFLPVLSGTLTTLAPFFPLAFWGGKIGKFMHYLPITLIITLTASLLVAYIINPVFAVSYMKPHNAEEEAKKGKWTKGVKMTTIILIALALIFYVFRAFGMGNFMMTLMLLNLLNRFVIVDWAKKFQTKTWPAIQNVYKKQVSWALERPWKVMGVTIALFFLSLILTGIRSPKVVFFPKGEPNFVYVYLSLPIGTDQSYTDSITKMMEERVFKVLGEKLPDNKKTSKVQTGNDIVESVISNVALGAGDPMDGDRGTYSHKGKVTVAFVEYAHRHGVSTSMYLDKIREAMKGIPGAEVTVDQERNGPPTPKPINIEISGDKFEDLVATSHNLKKYLDSLQISGVEELKTDFQSNKPEIVIDIDRERANRQAISTVQIGMEVRNAVFGKEISRYRDENDDYPIQLRYLADQRNNIDQLKELKVTYRDMAMNGMIRQIPLSAVANVHYANTFGGIKRLNQKRVITLSSNVLNGYNPNDVVQKIKSSVKGFTSPEGTEINMTGEQKDQKETASFLGRAMLIALGLIFLILVTQFNSFSKPIIILSEVIFSLIGVLLGLFIFRMDISIVMTGVGFVALGGIVVRNGILIVEFTDLLRKQGYGLKEAIIEAGKTRMTPVILTATATILGLIPLAIGFNIDFVTLFTELNPHIYLGGDSVVFWGPLSWTIIFGLSFATFVTLILVPVMYLLAENMKMKTKKVVGKK